MALSVLLVWYLVLCFFGSVSWTTACSSSKSKKRPNIADFPADNVCTTESCRLSAKHILDNMDADVDPCEDFYKFTCGGFRRRNNSSDILRRTASFSPTQERVNIQLRDALAEESPPDELNAFRQLKNFYKSCMNTTALRDRGRNPLWDIMDQLGGWPMLERDNWNDEKFNWMEALYKLNDFGFSTSFLMRLSATENPKNSSEHILTLLVDTEDKFFKNFVNYSYYTHRNLEDLAAILGVDDRAWVSREVTHIQGLVQLLDGIPRAKNYTEMTVAELAQQVPNFPVKEFVRRMLPEGIVVDDSEPILIKDPAHLRQFEKIISAVTKRVLANYIIGHALIDAIFFIDDELFHSYRKYISYSLRKLIITNDKKNRWKDCLKMVSHYLPIYVDALYIRKHFNEDTRTNVSEMAENVQEQFRIILENADWMDNATQEHALEKIDSMKSEIGYPIELMEDSKLDGYYEGLELDEMEFFQNHLKITRFLSRLPLNKLRSPTKEMTTYFPKSFIRTTETNAFYSRDLNTIHLPAAILQDYFFNNSRPHYVNYGAIGWIIGHEITHGFDSTESVFEKKENETNWWTPETEKTFTSKIQCIVDQYGNFTVRNGRKFFNGTLTQRENVADNGGIHAAYLAYQEWVENSNESEPTLPDLPYNPIQMFWITAANQFCSVYQKEWLTLANVIDSHALEDFRIHGPMSNRPEFAQDFNCPLGSKMNPEKKCSVW